jgi:putative ABC transport system substrate-binding protein
LTRLLAPGAPFAYLMNPPAPEAARYLQEIEDLTRSLKLPLVILKASSPGEIDTAFAALVRQHTGALIISTDGYLFSRRDQIVALAARNKIPTVYDRRAYAATGGLVSYGTDLASAFRQIGVYAGRILKGEKPADLPVVQPTKFELVVNLKTAKALGIDLPAHDFQGLPVRGLVTSMIVAIADRSVHGRSWIAVIARVNPLAPVFLPFFRIFQNGRCE